jgi:phosphate:Na+ symporter
MLFNVSNLAESVVGENVAPSLGLLDGLWSSTVYSGTIANTNTVFNLACAVLMLPMLGVYEKMSKKLVKDEPTEAVAGSLLAEPAALDALNPVFLATPALALNSCYKVLVEMFKLSRTNINRAFDLLKDYDKEQLQAVRDTEETIDHMADRVSNYLVQVSAHITAQDHVEIMDHYYAAISEFERLGDHAMNIAEYAEELQEEGTGFSEYALRELDVVRGLLGAVLSYTGKTFEKCDVAAAQHIEPLEEVVDDMVNALKQNHLDRLRERKCSVLAGTEFLNLLSDIERVSDICSNVGVATIARMKPEMKHEIHDYVSRLHAGKDAAFNHEYQAAHEHYFELLNAEEGK